MGRSRTELGEILKAIDGVVKVYFKQPSSRVEYPCIIYDTDGFGRTAADNIPYLLTQRYNITVISADPDSKIPEAVASLPLCSYDRSYKSNGLIHSVFTLYY